MIRDGDITISVLIRASHLTKIHQLLLLLADDLHLTTTTAHQWLRSSNVATCEVSGTHTSLCGTVAGLRHSHKSVWCCCWTASLTQVTHASPCGAVAGLRHSHKSVWRCCWTASLTQVTHASPCGAVAGLRHSCKSVWRCCWTASLVQPTSPHTWFWTCPLRNWHLGVLLVAVDACVLLGPTAPSNCCL